MFAVLYGYQEFFLLSLLLLFAFLASSSPASAQPQEPIDIPDQMELDVIEPLRMREEVSMPALDDDGPREGQSEEPTD